MYRLVSELRKQKEDIEKQIGKIRKNIVDSFPFKVGDKIRFRYQNWRDESSEKVAWIIGISLNDYKEDYVTLMVNYSRKNGERSKRKEYAHGVDANSIEILTE